MSEENKKLSTKELLSELITTIKTLNEKIEKAEKAEKQKQDMRYEILKMMMEYERSRDDWKDMLELIAIIRGGSPSYNYSYVNWQRRNK